MRVRLPSFTPLTYKKEIVPEAVVVNLFGGPGTGKSTEAASIFTEYKRRNTNIELVHEYAKDLTWEDRKLALSFQPYIAAKQMYHVHRVVDQVDIVVTDSPILLSNIYKGAGYNVHLGRHILQIFKGWDTLNIFLKRNSEAHPYREAGRNQTEQEAIKVDEKILRFLRYNNIPYHIVEVQKNNGTTNNICSLIDSHRIPS